MDHVTTTGTGAAAATPDAMQVSVALTVVAPSVAEALTGVAEAGRVASEVARRHTDERRVSTGGFTVQPNRDPHGNTLEDYRASHALHILCGLTGAGRLVTELAEAIGDRLQVHSVHPVVTDTSSLLQQARELAFADARAKASQLAGLAERTLGPALRIQEGGGRDQGWARQSVGLAARAALDFEAGSADVGAAVTVRWALLD